MELSVGVVFCAIGSVMFFAGILNVLPEATVFVWLTGLCLAAASLYRKEKLLPLISAGTAFFGLSCVFFYFLLNDSIFLHDDNFSHWAIATRVLLRENRFPNYSDVNIMFQSYPLGFSSFIYYFTACVGIRTEWMQMYAQAILMTGIVTSLFAFARTVPQKLLTAAGCVMMLASNTNFTELLVDTLLPVVAVGAIAFCLYYRDSLWEKIWWLMPYTAFLVSVKNSGIFFAVVIVVYLLTKVRSLSNLKLWIWSAVCPLGTLLLWQKHVKLVFDDGMMSFHSMSADYFSKMLGTKTMGDVADIFRAFCDKFFSFSNELLFVVPLLVLILVMLWKSGRKGYGRELAVLTLVSYASYVVMLFAMYLFTMPVHEARSVMGFVRYHDTVIIFLSGILVIGAVQAMEWLPEGGRLHQTVLALLCSAVLFGVLTPDGKFYQKQVPLDNIRGVYRQEFDYLIEEYNLQQNRKYILIIDSECTFKTFLKYLARYTLDPAKITVEYVEDVIKKESLLNGYEYLIAFTTAESVQDYMASHFGVDGDQRVVRLTGNK